MNKCPTCGLFLSKVEALENGLEEMKVTGFCKRHGIVEPTDWEYEDFAICSRYGWCDVHGEHGP